MACGNSIARWLIGSYSGLIGLEDPSQVPLCWEIVPVHKTRLTDFRKLRFKETRTEENKTQRELDLSLRLHPPEVALEDKLQRLGPSPSKRPKVDVKTNGPSLVVMECKACFLHVMVSEIAPKCPLCKRSSSLVDKFRSRY